MAEQLKLRLDPLRPLLLVAPESKAGLRIDAALCLHLVRLSYDQLPAAKEALVTTAIEPLFKSANTGADAEDLAEARGLHIRLAVKVLDAAQPPERKSKPKKALIAIIATLASGFALLLFVFVRQALANASQDEESAAKMAAIRSSWRRALGRV